MVDVVRPCRNVAPSPGWEYVAHPQDQLAAFLEIEDALGLDVIGLYHSHPRGPAHPSEVDAARATYAGASHVVVWLEPDEGLGSWTWTPPEFRPEPVEIRY
jgi:proteasome lid subunit RPN8/RPN11